MVKLRNDNQKLEEKASMIAWIGIGEQTNEEATNRFDQEILKEVIHTSDDDDLRRDLNKAKLLFVVILSANLALLEIVAVLLRYRYLIRRLETHCLPTWVTVAKVLQKNSYILSHVAIIPKKKLNWTDHYARKQVVSMLKQVS